MFTILDLIYYRYIEIEHVNVSVITYYYRDENPLGYSLQIQLIYPDNRG